MLFRSLRDKGIISYTEYLFLLSVLTSKYFSPTVFKTLMRYFLEPQSGFKIAFNMFDTDGNHRVDKSEFLVVSFRIEAAVNIFLFEAAAHGS